MIKIAIDGLSGSGKGELAKGLAKIFNLKHLDTGAIFRTMGIVFWKKQIADPKAEEVENYLSNAKIEINFETNSQRMFLDGEDVTPFLREEEVSKLASKVSAFSFAREKYLAVVGEFANTYDCVIDGRDITSIVLPNADVKFYLTADEKTRAERRYKENVEKKIECTFEEVLANLQERDYRDTHRDVAPLIIVDDAIVIDNTNLSIEETINKCSEIIKATLSKK
ncbi:MAG: (d)CMP kinase [Clostridia bacterium]|nr:(d)CMP kinase [Clostridia bacterium]